MISDDDAGKLRDLRAAANAERERIESMPRPAQRAYYEMLLAIADAGGTYREIAEVLGVHVSRVGQLIDQAKRNF